MGYELNKLLEHYGLSSPTIASYGGSTDAERGAYDAYVNSYKDRVKNTSMYGQKFSGDKLSAPTFATPAATTTPAASTSTPSAPVPYVAPSGGLFGGAINTGVNAGVIAPVNNTLTNASSTLFQGPTPLFSGMFGGGILSGLNSGILGMYRAKGGSIDTAAEKQKLAKKYGFGGTVESGSVDPMTLRYYNPQPDPLAPIKPEVSAGDINPITLRYYNPQPDPMAEVPMEISAEKIVPNVQMYDDYPNLSDMLSSKAQIPAMYQLDENGQPVISQEPVAPQVPDQPDLGQLSAKYSEMSPYAAQIAESRKIAKAESDAFTKMIQGQLTSPEQNNLSKAEMYFRLAAAFGSPTRTKQGFMENLGAAGQQLAEYSKGARSDEAAKNALRLEAQKLRMQTAKEDLTTLRTLAAEEMKDKRALDLELLKEKIKADQPLSAEGKAAYDIGLRKGTPEFSQKVEDFVNAKNEARAAGVLVQQGNLDVNRAKLAKENKDLSSTELQLKQQTESLINSSSDALNMVERALKLNDEARITSGVSGIKHTVLSNVNSDDPTTKATNELLNLLKSKTYSNLKATFGGQLSDGERKALEGVSGSEAKSPEERKRILINAAAALRNARERSKKQLDAISSGSYGEKIEKTK